VYGDETPTYSPMGETMNFNYKPPFMDDFWQASFGMAADYAMP